MAISGETLGPPPKTNAPPSSPYTFRHISATETYPIRRTVLWPGTPLEDQGLPRDEEALHFGAFAGESTDGKQPASISSSRLIAVVSVYPDDRFPFFVDRELFHHDVPDISCHARIRKFATLQEYQGTGAGTALLQYAKVQTMAYQAKVGREAPTEQRSVDPPAASFFWLDAREAAAPWYERRGWKKLGEPFDKYGGKTYRAMGSIERM